MRNKVIIISVILLLLSVIATESCRKCDNEQVYKVTDLDFMVTGVQYNANANPKIYYFLIENDSIFFSFYGIILEPVKQLYAACQLPRSFGIINSAYACDPVLVSMKNRITDIHIITDKDYDDTHPKGSNIAEYFDIVVTYEHTNDYYSKYSLQEFLAKTPHVPDQMTLILNTEPKTDTKFNFKLRYFQEGSDLDSLEIDLGKITIIK